MNLQHMREFVVLADTSNYMEAAERLFIGQSTLSKHIMAMEQELGVSLFNRTSRKVSLSRFGRLLLPYAKIIVQAQYDYTAELENELESIRGRVTIGTVSATAKYGITNVIARFKRENPECTVWVFEEDTEELLSHLKRRKCNLIFTHLPPGEGLEEGIVSLPFREDRLVALLPRSHPLAGQSLLRLEQLQEDTFVVLSENSMVYQLGLDTCHRVGFSPRIAFTCQRVDSALDLVTKGLGVCLMMEYQTVRPEDSGFPYEAPFVALPILPEVRLSLHLCYRPEELSPAAKRFLQAAQEEIAARGSQ